MELGKVKSDTPIGDAVQFSKQYVALADKIISNTSAETSALSTSFAGAGRMIRGDKLNVGSVIRLRGGGVYTTPLVVVGSLTIRVKVGNTVVASTVISSLTGNMISQPFSFNCALIVRATGVQGVIAPLGNIELSAGVASKLKSDFVETANPVQLDTTIDNNIDVTVQWSTATTDRIVRVTGATINIES